LALLRAAEAARAPPSPGQLPAILARDLAIASLFNGDFLGETAGLSLGLGSGAITQTALSIR
jgi:hypothetical protein